MTGNLYEFIGMAFFVSATTMFVVGLRWAIYKLDNSEVRRHRTIGDKFGKDANISEI